MRSCGIRLLGLLAAVVALASGCGHGGAGDSSGSLEGFVQRGQGASSQYEGGPPYPGPCVKAGDKDGDGEPEWVLNRVYNRHGHVIREVYDHGADGTADAIISYEYDGENLVRRAKDNNADGNAEQITNFTYDDQGRRTELAVDVDADGAAEKTTRFEYESGKQVRKTIDYGSVGEKVDGIWTYEYEDDRLIRQDWDQDADGQIDETTLYEYDEQGHLRRKELYYGDEDRPAKVVEYDRNDDGQILEERVDKGDDGRIDKRMVAEYEKGRRTQVVTDRGGDGTADEKTRLKYNRGGNVVRREWDAGADGAVDRVTTFGYKCWQ